MTAVEIAETAGHARLNPDNPVVASLAARALESGEPIEPARLAVASRDGRLTDAELKFCRAHQIEPAEYVRVRQNLKPRNGRTRFEELLFRVYEIERED